MTDVRDMALYNACPIVPVPHYGDLDSMECVQAYRYLAAADGLYLQTQTPLFDLILKKSSTTLPYGAIKQNVRMIKGVPDKALWDEIKQFAVQQFPNECAMVVVWSHEKNKYIVHYPTIIEASAHSVNYATDGFNEQDVLCHLHSHAAHPAYFSETDNQSDLDGVYFSMVLGTCHNMKTIQVVTRLVVFGNFFDLTWNPLNL